MILFFTNAYPDFPGSFRGHFVRKLAITLKQRGVNPVVVTPRVFKKSLFYQRDEQNLEVYRFYYPSADRQLLTFSRVPWFRMLCFCISGIISSLRICRKYPCRWIHAHWVVPTGFLGAIVGMVTGIPLISHARGSDMHTWAGRGRIMKAITKWTLQRSHQVIVASHDIREIMERDFNIDGKKIHVIPTGIDTELFSPSRQSGKSGQFGQYRQLGQSGQPRSMENHHGSNGLKPEAGGLNGETDGLNWETGGLNQENSSRRIGKKIKIGYVGGLYRQKGLAELLSAAEKLFAAHAGVELIFIGEGPFRRDIELWAETRNYCNRVTLHGEVSHGDIPHLMGNLDIFVLPSHNEGTPNSLLEAMACGIPSVATRVGGIPHVMEHGHNGLLIEPRDPEMLHGALLSLMENPDLYRRIAGNSRTRAMCYSQSLSADKIMKIYDNTLGLPG